MRYRSARLLSIIPLLIPPALTACSGRATDTNWIMEERGGIATRVYRSAEPPRLDPYRLEPGAIFGTDQSEATFLWRYAQPLAELPDGGLLAFGGRNETGLVQRFSADGRYLGSFGRYGEGPGELRAISPIFVTDDEITFIDGMNRCLSRFDLTGTFREQQRLPAEIAAASSLSLLPRSGGLFTLTSLNGRGLSATADETVFGWRFLIQALENDLRPVTTHLDSTYHQTWFMVDNRYFSPPFEREAPVLFATAPALPVAWVESDDYTIQFLDPDTGRRSALSLPHSPVAVTAELRARCIEHFVSEGWSEEGLNRLPLARTLPAIHNLEWDGQGRLWVRDFTAGYTRPEPTEYWFNVFAPDGRWLFRQYLPGFPSLFGREGFYESGEADDGSPVIRSYRFRER